MASSDGGGKNRVIRDKAMASHLKKMGYPHGRRFSAPSWPFNKEQVGSNKYVRYLESRRDRRIK